MSQLWSCCVQFYKRTDRWLLCICLLASSMSIFFQWGIYLSGYIKPRVVTVQVVATILGIVVACAISLFDYRNLAKLWKIYLPISVGLIILTYFIGIQRYSYIDDKAWLYIPFTEMTFQPSEILKLALILSFALHLEKAKDSVNQIKSLLLLVLHGLLPVMLIVLQGDHGSAMVFAAIFACMLFSAGLSLKYIAAAILSAVVASPLVWFFILDNEKRGRFLAVLDPSLDPAGAGWQQNRGLISIGSGQVWGKGVLTAEAQYVPEMHNDFIFAFIGESTGFLGCCAVLAILFIICLFLLRNAHRAKDPLGRFICVGVFILIAFQSIWVIGMCLSLLPVAGLTLPFFSAGGTSVTLTYCAIGLAMSVYRHSSVTLFHK